MNQLLNQISNFIIDFAQDPIKTGVTSASSVATGTMISFNTHEYWTYILQYSAWGIGIIAGIFAIVAGIQKQIDRYKYKHSNINTKTNNDYYDDSWLDNMHIEKAKRKIIHQQK